MSARRLGGRLEGRTAIVTGAARGIGLAIARRLGHEGAAVVAGDLDDAVADEAFAGSAFSHAVARLDVTSEDDAARLVTLAENRFGRLDILVNNAAVLDTAAWADLTMDAFRNVLAVNLHSVLIMTRAAAPAMARAGGGRVLNVASIMGLFGAKDYLSYATAKGGVVNLTRTLACELAPHGITVNAIAPGFIDTRMAIDRHGEHEHQSELFQRFYLGHEKIPLARAGAPADVAGPAAFLCSDDAGYVTGQILPVDGGVTATY